MFDKIGDSDYIWPFSTANKKAKYKSHLRRPSPPVGSLINAAPQQEKNVAPQQEKTFLFVYSTTEDGDIIIERLTRKKINGKIVEHGLDEGEYTIIDGQVVS